MYFPRWESDACFATLTSTFAPARRPAAPPARRPARPPLAAATSGPGRIRAFLTGLGGRP
jgi:hypothetical protein